MYSAMWMYLSCAVILGLQSSDGVRQTPIQLDQKPGSTTATTTAAATTVQLEDKAAPAPAPTWAPADAPGNLKCGTAYSLNGLPADLPDLVENAATWCNSELVPPEKRVPEELRGFYWLKDLGLSDVAFCGSLGEWDNATRTAKYAVWTTFVFGTKVSSKEASLAGLALGKAHGFNPIGMLAKGIFSEDRPLVYEFVFENKTNMETARIIPNSVLYRSAFYFSFKHIDTVPTDTTIPCSNVGDCWERGTYFAGVRADRYHAVRVMKDDGTIREEIANKMKAKEGKEGKKFMRYALTC